MGLFDNHTGKVHNICGEESGDSYECKVCGLKWHTFYYERMRRERCYSTCVIREWDGSQSWVHTQETKDGMVEIVYQDGTKHVVTKDYYKSIFIQS